MKDSYKDAISDFDHLHLQTNNLMSMFLALSDQKANQVKNARHLFGLFLAYYFYCRSLWNEFQYMPEITKPYGYFATLGLMGLIVIITFIYVRRKNGKKKDIKI